MIVEIPDPQPWTIGPVTRTDFVRYQGASGDMNPLHHDENFARQAGFSAPIAVGMWHAGLLGSFAADWLGPQNVRRFRVRFREPVLPGDVLTCTGSVLQRRQQDGEPQVDIELTCATQSGDIAATAWASFAVPSLWEQPDDQEIQHG